MDIAAIHRKILQWYSQEKRDLPWRKSQDPYRIWISEIMLQQTRVEAVLPYYHRFLSNFPTVKDLATADLDRVLNLWAGLGYYSRARNLHAAANQVMEQFGGIFPSTFEELRGLKGIGPYTAAAISSMAFGRAHCALDGNLERVFARLLALRENPKTSGRKSVEAFGAQLVQRGHAGDVNQAFMDLASSVCLPKEPRCPACPLSGHCEARALGLQREIPVRALKAEKVHLRAAAWAVVADGQLLLARRPKGAWLAGMWDIPWKVIQAGEGATAPFGEEVAICAENRTITKHKIAFEVHGLRCARAPSKKELGQLCAEADEFRWVPLEDLHGINLPRPSEKALEKILLRLN